MSLLASASIFMGAPFLGVGWVALPMYQGCGHPPYAARRRFAAWQEPGRHQVGPQGLGGWALFWGGVAAHVCSFVFLSFFGCTCLYVK